jgi:hypothetical protein
VAAGLADTEEPVVALSPVAGAQEYVLAPEALSVPAMPVQMVIGETVMVGKGFTVTITVVVLIHPAAEVPVTV